MKKSIKIFLKVVCFIMAGCIIALGCYLFHLKREMDLEEKMFNGDQLYTYRESTLFAYKWQHHRKHFIDDVRNKRMDLNSVLSIMEFENVSIEQMDSIMGDSLWRVQENIEEGSKEE